MLTAFLRLFALRPILAGSLLGIPLLTLLILGLATVLFVVLPFVLVTMLVRAVTRPRAPHVSHTPPEPIQTM